MKLITVVFLLMALAVPVLAQGPESSASAALVEDQGQPATAVVVGPQGPRGERGPRGPQGQQGVQGPVGTFSPEQSSQLVIAYDRGNMSLVWVAIVTLLVVVGMPIIFWQLGAARTEARNAFHVAMAHHHASVAIAGVGPATAGTDLFASATFTAAVRDTARAVVREEGQVPGRVVIIRDRVPAPAAETTPGAPGAAAPPVTTV
ncbi:MAG: hypothetical protein HYY50_03040 [Candidatus Kerfeldbacteria bacterium]|nr:hypothetical protein [Candidatus Kerfeldbacteria bacterium]